MRPEGLLMSEAAPVRPVSARSSEGPDPLLIDLGKVRRKDVKQLRKGQGRLLEEIASALKELRTSGQIATDAQPVVVLIRERRKRPALWPLA
jgi:hypothetical protein